MEEIDYSHYSKEDLEDVLRHIDREKYPERTALVQALYESKKDIDNVESSSFEEGSFSKARNLISAMLFIICAPFVLIYGVQSERLFYSINIESLWARSLTCIFMISLAIVMLVKWSKNEN